MKKLFLFLTAVLMTVGVMAEGHMKFKGVEINGKLQPFVAALVKQNFKQMQIDKETAVLVGTFNGQETMVCVYTTPSSYTVYQVGVIFTTDLEEWSKIWNLYTTYKTRLETKYGAPTEVVEENHYYTKDDPLWAVKRDKAEYKTKYETENGNVGVSINKFPYPLDVQVCLFYVDKQNYELNEQEALEDL